MSQIKLNLKLRQRAGMLADCADRFVRKRMLGIIGCSGALLLAFVLTLALVSNRANSNATDTMFNVNATNSSVAIYVDGVAGGGNDLDTTVITSLDGSVSSVSTQVRVVTDALHGYALALQAQTANMIGQSNSSNVLVPIANATIENPSQFTAGSCNSWGFATPGVSSNFSQAFDTAYTELYSVGVNTASSNFAAVPTSASLIHTSTAQDETRPYYFAACVNSTMPSDTYSATVVWSAYAVDSPPQVGNVIVDIDPGMIPVRWNYDACSFGNGFGNVMASAPETNSTPTDPTANSCWVKADTNVHSLAIPEAWYNYSTDNTATRDSFGQPYYANRKWANAVTFASTSDLSTYQAAAVGTPIPDSVISAYWTYLPRFEYKVENFNYNASNFPKAFDVRLTNNTLAYTNVASIDVGLDPTTSPQYLTPPAFTNGGSELNGIWFGKFATTGAVANPTIKPGVNSIVSQTTSAFFQAGLLFGNSGIPGGTVSFTGANQHNFANLSTQSSGTFTSGVSSMQSLNSQWGAIVYFTQSMYGVCSNMNCTSDDQPLTGMAIAATTERVRNNAKSSPYMTGCGPNILDSTDSATTTTCNLYNTQLGVLASTTHNVYGIYDLAGGVWEYTTGNYVTGEGANIDAYAPTPASSGFSNLSAMFSADALSYIPYFDAYPNPSLTNNVSDITNGNYGLGSSGIINNSNWGIYASKLGLGQAIFESAGWSGAYAGSFGSGYPWFVRGSSSVDADQAARSVVESIGVAHGGVNPSVGFRGVVVIRP
ncbi:hypothetical protein FWH09_00020 [Candidatus Saccharibacteria bacterium]|nr:hypothetical protein [Candidatus Saccharibacteria bacterium]